MIECGLQQVHFRLQQIALRLRHQKARRQPDFIPALFGIEPAFGERRPRFRRVHALGGAANLTRGLPDRFRRLQLQARYSAAHLSPLELGARGSSFLVAPSERVARRQSEAPRRIVAAERLPEHIAKTGAAASGNHPWEGARAQQLRSAQSVAAI